MNEIIPIGYMATKVARKYGPMAKETLKMRSLALAYKMKRKTYEDCKNYYERCMGRSF